MQKKKQNLCNKSVRSKRGIYNLKRCPLKGVFLVFDKNLAQINVEAVQTFIACVPVFSRLSDSRDYFRSCSFLCTAPCLVARVCKYFCYQL